MNVPTDFDLKLAPNGSFAILTNRKDVTLESLIAHDMLEIFTHNAGYQVKIFTNYDEAQVWLTWNPEE